MKKKTQTKRIAGLAREAQDALEAAGLTRQQCIEYRDAVRFYGGLSDAQKEEFRRYFTDGEQTGLVTHVLEAASPAFLECLKGIVRAAAELDCEAVPVVVLTVTSLLTLVHSARPKAERGNTRA